MIREEASPSRRPLTVDLTADLVVAGGGMAGTCCAIAAAREGLRVILVQDRPVLGGNASSEVRLWILGATSHMGNNNRWSREGGVVNEILEENLYRNRQGNAHILDTVLLEKTTAEPNITLLLDTAVHDIEKNGADAISAIHAFCSQNSTRYVLRAPFFCDASGDGIVGFLAGAAFRMGAESKDEFDEAFAPGVEYGELLGHSMYFYTKDAGVPVKFVPPSFALQDITKIPHYRRFNTNMQGCNFWWIEYGGRLDTIHKSQDIKWELWRVIYGIWNYIKNSGNFPEAETLTLEWVGHIPGKRESRRFEGDYMIHQRDVVGQTAFDDVFAHGGWAMDLHPADGLYSPLSSCTQWHSKGVYGIPYRCYYSRNISNLFLAGRIISATHVAFGSTRVMATCGAGGQGVGIAAALCKEHGCNPRDLSSGSRLADLQKRLVRAGQYLPGRAIHDDLDLAGKASASASSALRLGALPSSKTTILLDHDWAMLLPFAQGSLPSVSFAVSAAADTTLRVQLRRSLRPGNFTPDEILETLDLQVAGGESQLPIRYATPADRAGYYFVCLMENRQVQVHTSRLRMSGVIAVTSAFNRQVATSSRQSPPPDIGIDSFEFWLPKRRPFGENLACTIDPPLACFQPENALTGPARPTDMPNVWVADPADPQPTLTLTWPQPVALRRVLVELDPDWDHPLESVLMTHPDDVSPFLIKDFDILGDGGETLASIRENHSGRLEIAVATRTRTLTLRVLGTHGAPAAVFRVRCFA